MEDTKLEFRDDALKAIAKKAIELKDKAIIKGNNYKEIVEELIQMKDSLIKLGSLTKSDLINCFKY